MHFHVSTTRFTYAEATVIVVDGQFDLASVASVAAPAEESILTGRPTAFDLSGCTFIDSSAMRFLVQVARVPEVPMAIVVAGRRSERSLPRGRCPSASGCSPSLRRRSTGSTTAVGSWPMADGAPSMATSPGRPSKELGCRSSDPRRRSPTERSLLFGVKSGRLLLLAQSRSLLPPPDTQEGRPEAAPLVLYANPELVNCTLGLYSPCPATDRCRNR
jgi:STAS domain-containing protein